MTRMVQVEHSGKHRVPDVIYWDELSDGIAELNARLTATQAELASARAGHDLMHEQTEKRLATATERILAAERKAQESQAEVALLREQLLNARRAD